MNRGPLLLCGWPGLPGLWYRGDTSSLLVAVGFSILLNLALVSSFLWPWSLGEIFPLVAWPIISLIWVTSALITYRNLPDLMSVTAKTGPSDHQQSDTLFIQAQREYLGGHWSEAEALLKRCLSHSPRDIEARLLLATLLRHCRRLPEAVEELNNINKYDESVNWIFEIRREQKLIELIAEHEVSEVAKTTATEMDGPSSNNDGYVRA